MGYRYYICDVFTDTRFGGNQLAVLPEAAGLSRPADAADRPRVQLLRDHLRASGRARAHPPGPDLHARRPRCRSPAIPTSAPRSSWRPRASSARSTRADHGHVRGEGRPGADHDRAGATARIRCELSRARAPHARPDASPRRSLARPCRSPPEDVVTRDPPAAGGLGRPAVPVAELRDRAALERARADMRRARGAGARRRRRPTCTSTSGAATSSTSAPACSRRSTACPRTRRPAAPTARSAALLAQLRPGGDGELPLAHRPGRRDGAAERARGARGEARGRGRGGAGRRGERAGERRKDRGGDGGAGPLRACSGLCPAA